MLNKTQRKATFFNKFLLTNKENSLPVKQKCFSTTDSDISLTAMVLAERRQQKCNVPLQLSIEKHTRKWDELLQRSSLTNVIISCCNEADNDRDLSVNNCL